MSLLTICRNVTAAVGWPIPSGVAANSDGTAQQLLALANEELEHLSEQYDWPHLEVEYTFSTVVDQAVYALPDSFRKLGFGSVYNATEYYQIRGSMNLEEWNRRKRGLLGNISCLTSRLVYPNGVPSLELTPAPSSVETVVAFYYTSNYARNESGDLIPRYVSDTDTSVIPERLIQLGLKWRFRRAKGLDYSAELAEYNSVVSQQYVARKAPQDIPVGGRRYSYDSELGPGYVRDSGFGA